MKTQKEIFNEWKTASKSLASLNSIIQNPIPDNLSAEDKEKLKKDIEFFRKQLFSYQIVLNKLSMDISSLFVEKGIL